MKTGISRTRLRRIAKMRRARARAAAKFSFRDGAALAILVVALLFFADMAMCWLAKCSTSPYSSLAMCRTPAAAECPAAAAISAQACHAMPWAEFGTDAVVLLGSFTVARLLLGLLAPEVLERNSRIVLTCLIALAADALELCVLVGAARLWPVLLPGSPPGFAALVPFLVPSAFAPALATLLLGQGAGVALAAGLSTHALLLMPRRAALAATLVALAASAAVPSAVSRIRDRAGLLKVFLATGALQLAFLLVSALPFGDGIKEALQAPAGPQPAILGAALCVSAAAILATIPGHVATLALLRPLEHLFAACSNLRLARYADLRNPLLSRLAMEAPGTYHHSLVVANLASAAAESIGANSLLCLVGGYYHDVGKLSNPANFTENHLPGDVNPHDSLPPNLSAIILASHVKDGIGQALDNNLPAPVRQIIREHHGTSKMAFFLAKARDMEAAKARESGREPNPVDENQFRYAGPKPSSAESAIVSIADSIEAASRALDKPSAASIEKLVDGIVAAKVSDGQFDDAPLTYAEVADLRRAFAAELATIRHARIAYPKDAQQPPPQATQQQQQNTPAPEPRDGGAQPDADASTGRPEATRS